MAQRPEGLLLSQIRSSRYRSRVEAVAAVAGGEKERLAEVAGEAGEEAVEVGV